MRLNETMQRDKSENIYCIYTENPFSKTLRRKAQLMPEIYAWFHQECLFHDAPTFRMMYVIVAVNVLVLCVSYVIVAAE